MCRMIMRRRMEAMMLPDPASPPTSNPHQTHRKVTSHPRSLLAPHIKTTSNSPRTHLKLTSNSPRPLLAPLLLSICFRSRRSRRAA